MIALRAFRDGIWMVVRAPGLLILVTCLTLGAMLPFALALGDRLRDALGNQPPIDLGAEEIDADWWLEFRAHARGLEATFTPAVIGFAAPLDNLSTLADGSPRPLVMLAPIGLYGLIWAFLWGGLLERFGQGHRIGVRPFMQAGTRHLVRFTTIATAAAVMAGLLYLTVHAWLLGPVFQWGAVRAGDERNVFLWRVALYLVFGALLASVSLLADYARVATVLAGARTIGDALRTSLAFVRGHRWSVVSLFLLNVALFVLLLVMYGVADRRFAGWRGVALGQAYIVARLGIRLTSIASEARLFQTASSHAQAVSVGRENPGPPAAT